MLYTSKFYLSQTENKLGRIQSRGSEQDTSHLGTKGGTHYFFLSPLPLVSFHFMLVRYFQKFVSPLALVRYSATAIFAVVRWQRCH
jgi:hypothetical protein